MTATTPGGATPSQSTEAAGSGRDWTIDLIRIGSLAIVVAMHWLYTQTSMVDGKVTSQLALHGPFAWTLTWVLQVMPLFFIAGGFANTMVADRCAAKGQSYGEYLGLRARRLTTPVVLLALVIVPIATVASAVAEDLGRQVGDHSANPLWFLAVYLVCVSLAPLMVRIHDRNALAAPVVLLALALTVDVVRFAGQLPHDELAQLNLVFVWLCCHQLGIVHARGSLRRVPDAVLALAAAGCVAALVAMVLPGPWFPTVLGIRDAPVSNLAPPTAVLCLLGVIQLCLLTAITRRLPGWRPGAKGRGVVETLNAMLMVIFLWHVPVLIALTGVAMLWPPLLPAEEGLWWALRPVWFLVSGLVLWGVTLQAMRWEIWINRYAARSALLPAALGAGLATVGIYVVWGNGMWLQGPSIAGLAAIVVGAALLTTRRRVAAG